MLDFYSWLFNDAICLYQDYYNVDDRMINEYGAVCGMKTDKENQSA
jgi:hypothetical protein